MNLKDFVFWTMIIIIIALAGYMAFWIKTEPYKCVANPYTYSIKLLEESNHGNVTCMCNSENGAQAILTNQGFTNIPKYESIFDEGKFK